MIIVGDYVYRQAGIQIPEGNPWRNRHRDILDALDHLEDYADKPLDLEDFDIHRTWMTIEDFYYYDDIDAWLNTVPGELKNASQSELFRWTRQLRGDHFEDLIDNGITAVVVMDATWAWGIGDGRGRINLAIALGIEELPVLYLVPKGEEPHHGKGFDE